MKKQAWVAVTAMVAVLLCGVVSIEAQTLSNRPDGTAEWSADFLIYWWGTSFDGDAAVGTASQGTVEGDFSNFDASEISGTGLLQIRHESRWGLLIEGARAAGDQDISTPDGAGTLDADFGWLTVAGTYTVDGPVLVEPFAGVRFFTAEGSEVVGSTQVGDETRSWVDPLVGVNLQWTPIDRFGLGLMADVGGFGVNSELTWDVVPTARYHFNQMFSALLGYRYFYLDYDKSNVKLDLAMQGPFLGLGVRF